MVNVARQDLLSVRLVRWLDGSSPKTLRNLSTTFTEESFALFFLVLMAIPALPLPTGGVTHIFEIINMLIALEMIIGRRTVWLPMNWQDLELSERLRKSTLPRLIRYIRKVEKFSRPRLAGWLRNHEVLRFVGLIVFLLTLTAFLAPPFSGLDTLPAFGVVLIALSLLMNDIVLFMGGLISGAVGLLLILTLGGIAVRLF